MCLDGSLVDTDVPIERTIVPGDNSQMKLRLSAVVAWASAACLPAACGGARGVSAAPAVRDGGATSGDAAVPPAGDSGGSTARDASGAREAGSAQTDSGTQVTPPPVATPCDADGGLGPVGVWQPIWLPQSFLPDPKLETSSVAVDPHDQAVYVAAGSYTNGGDSGTGVYRSSDCGATFQLASTGMDSMQVASGDPWVLRADASVPGTIYLVVGYGAPGGLYESTDRGANWNQLAISPWEPANMPLTPQALGMSPSSDKTLALSFHDDCTSPYSALCFGVTTNGGATWSAINGPTLSTSGWQEAASLSIVADDTLLYLGASSGTVSYSNDNGGTWSTPTFTTSSGAMILPQIGESYGGSTYFGPDGTLYVATASGIFRSSGASLGTQWTQVKNSPNADCLIDDGTYLYASDTWTGNGQYGNGDGQVFWRAPLNDLTSWTQMTSPDSPRGSYEFAYDKIHHNRLFGEHDRRAMAARHAVTCFGDE
jgi:hypothetical protein